jgi:hypothetical protein
MRTMRRILTVHLLLLTGYSIAVAQAPPDDPLRDHFFPPELVMQNQQAIGLSEDQRNAIKADLRQAQQRFTELQWKLDDEMERFVALVGGAQVDESQALAQLDRVLAAPSWSSSWLWDTASGCASAVRRPPRRRAAQQRCGSRRGASRPSIRRRIS